MTQPAWLRSRPAPGQGGYILSTVLALMFFSVLVLSGLLAVTASTSRIEESGRSIERQSRAAEGAVEVAINQIRNDPLIASADQLNRKEPSDPGYIVGAPKHQQPIAEPGDAQYNVEEDPNVNRGAIGGACEPVQELIEVDGYPVRVFCFNEDLSSTDPDGNLQAGIPEDDGAIAVRLVGDEYKGDPKSVANDHLVDKARTWRTSFPFSASGAITGYNAPELTATEGQLVYSGKYPLRIVGGVEVKRQIAAISSGATGPAIEVQGVARQGGEGMFGTGTGDLDCGIARQAPADENNSPRGDVVIDSNYAVVGEGLRCNQLDVKALPAAGTNPTMGWTNALVYGWKYQDWDGNGSQFNASNVLDPMPTDCSEFGAADPTRTAGNGAGIAVIPAGSYDARATKILNQMFTNCDNYTWYFERGNYWFDVFDPDAADTDPAKHSLVFDNRSSDWVFGPMVDDAGFNAGTRRPQLANFPDKVCNRNPPPSGYDGVNITLSSRTGVHHEKGRVVICGMSTVGGSNETAIYQQPAASLGARLLPGGISAGDFTNTSAARLHATDGDRIRTDPVMPPNCWDSGTCSGSTEGFLRRSFTATNMGIGAPNGPNGGASAVSSVYVDVAGGGDRVTNPNQDLTSTKLEVTVKNADGSMPSSPTCSMTYGPAKAEGRRLPGNNTLVSYDLLDSTVTGDCDTALAGVTRDRYYGSSVKATFDLNPPSLRNTQFDWLDWWPWLRDQVTAACNNYNGWGISTWLNNNIGLIDWYWRCDDRPQSITYSIDSMALRLGWAPSFVSPVDASTTSTGCGSILSFVNPGNGVRWNQNGTANPEYATVTQPSNFNTGCPTSFSTLRYKVVDPTLADGFLPLERVDFTIKAKRTGTFPNDDSNIVYFTLKSPDDKLWCRNYVRISQLNDTEQTLGQAILPTGPLVTDASGTQVIRGCVRPTDTTFGMRPTDPQEKYPEIGQFVTHYRDPSPTTNCSPITACEEDANLDVSVLMSRQGAEKKLEIDYVTMTAQASGYSRPLDPFTVTWNPMTPNDASQACCWSAGAVPSVPNEVGDATFNVWGSVSVPNNDVRVVWNWDTARGRGPTGFPIFNSGDAPFARCNSSSRDQCQPALVASALGSWTTTSTSGAPNTSAWPDLDRYSQPDPLASTGDTRPSVRKVRIHACVVDANGSGNNGDLLPRVEAQVTIADREATKKIRPGARVWVTSWQSTRDPAYQPGADALTNECDTSP